MAIISKVSDEPSPSAPFLDRLPPPGLLEAAVDFLRRKSDLLSDDDVRAHLAAAVSAAKAVAEKKRKLEARKAEEGKKEAAPAPAPAPAASAAMPEVDIVGELTTQTPKVHHGINNPIKDQQLPSVDSSKLSKHKSS